MAALPIDRRYPDEFTKENLGEIQNVLHILSPDFKSFSPRLLIKAYSHVTDLADMLGVQRTQLYLEQIPLKKGSKLRNRIIQLVIVTDLAYILLGKSEKKILRWLVAPNLIFFGSSPLEVIMRDEGEMVISWLMERAGRKPGAAF